MRPLQASNNGGTCNLRVKSHSECSTGKGLWEDLSMRVQELWGRQGTIRKFEARSCESTCRRKVILSWSRLGNTKMKRHREMQHMLGKELSGCGNAGEVEVKDNFQFLAPTSGLIEAPRPESRRIQEDSHLSGKRLRGQWHVQVNFRISFPISGSGLHMSLRLRFIYIWLGFKQRCIWKFKRRSIE